MTSLISAVDKQTGTWRWIMLKIAVACASGPALSFLGTL
jgi:hypothetical protein